MKVGVAVNEVGLERKGVDTKTVISLWSLVKSVEAVSHLSTYFGLSKYKDVV